jgi:hypothetical protein
MGVKPGHLFPAFFSGRLPASAFPNDGLSDPD